jgi:hypothetical protein
MTFLLKVMTDGINLYLFHVKWEVLLTRIIDENNVKTSTKGRTKHSLYVEIVADITTWN